MYINNRVALPVDRPLDTDHVRLISRDFWPWPISELLKVTWVHLSRHDGKHPFPVRLLWDWYRPCWKRSVERALVIRTHLLGFLSVTRHWLRWTTDKCILAYLETKFFFFQIDKKIRIVFGLKTSEVTIIDNCTSYFQNSNNEHNRLIWSQIQSWSQRFVFFIHDLLTELQRCFVLNVSDLK